MITSMTGYGRALSTLNGKTLTVEIKSVNHRNLEIIVRLPGILSALEAEIKKMIGESLSRGRIEVGIRSESDLNRDTGEKLEVNLTLLKSYYGLLKQLKEEFHLTDEINLKMIADFRDAFYYPEQDVDLQETWEQIKTALAQALAALIEMRKKEGSALYGDFRGRLGTISEHMETLKGRAPKVVEEYHERLSRRVRELTNDLEMDASRLTQEVAIMAEKSDITEEIVRLESHLDQFA
ncbi:MAG: YicC family protein, partial [Deltaproteobacteria bacterium]|nr:YicC family protein [Deltaproteobacteria bacterium]